MENLFESIHEFITSRMYRKEIWLIRYHLEYGGGLDSLFLNDEKNAMSYCKQLSEEQFSILCTLFEFDPEDENTYTKQYAWKFISKKGLTLRQIYEWLL